MHTGVTQMMNNQNYCSKQSSMNMIALSNVKEQSKDAKRRQVKLSQWGKECPSESPEGKQRCVDPLHHKILLMFLFFYVIK